jgi:molybdopterin/thiamine biosynthesis adenylyltransferase
MAPSPELIVRTDTPALLRLASPELQRLKALLFRRYPRYEWATFARFGWRPTGLGLVLTLTSLDEPARGDLDETVGHVAITEPYTLRVALTAETHPLAVGVIHSHPQGYLPRPSLIDDDMDAYYASYLRGFAPGRPYVSVILSEVDGGLAISGRLFWQGEWRAITRITADQAPLPAWVGGVRPAAAVGAKERTRRLAAAFGEQAADRLRRSTVAVVGVGGTGSAAIEVLARAGVGRLILIDPDHLEESNLERVHGSRPEHARQRVPKVVVAREHVYGIDPACEVQALVGALPQPEVVDALVTADAALGCTDQQHSRLALSDLAFRYLVPALDTGVLLEGRCGAVTGQVAQFVRFLPADPCALCRGMVVPERIAQELMSEEERVQRRAAAAAARARGQEGGAYWSEQPQLNTVGYLTTMVGSLAAGYVIGWLTGRFVPPFSRLQLDLAARDLGVIDVEQDPRPDCTCRRARGWADQGAADALITPPAHWPAVRVV